MDLTCPQKANGLPVLTRLEVDRLAEEILKDTYPLNLQIPSVLNTRDFLDRYLELLVKDAYIGDYDSGILGLTVMCNEVDIPVCDHMLRPDIWSATYGTVIISQRLSGTQNAPRRRYTEAHEASHWLLHRDYYNALAAREHKPSCYIACREVERYKAPRRTNQDWCEWQADTLAASLLMPQEVFHDYASSLLRQAGMRGSCLVQGNPEDKLIFSNIIDTIASTFGVSHRAAQIRMIHLGLIKTLS